jgi:hypothetical protein
MKKLLAPILATAVALLTAQPAWAYIDPYFTPVIMTRQSDIILHLQVESVKDMQATFTVVEALKGKTDQKTISLDLSKVAVKEQREFLEKKLKDIGKMPVLMFYGSFQRDQGSEKEAVAFLHVEDGWAACFTKDGKWIFDGMDQKMAGTYQGSTDMLLRAVKYILGDEGADMPVREDIAWDGEPVKFAQIDGKVRAALPVDLAGTGKTSLYIACENGDRIFEYDAAAKEKFVDVTARYGLSAKSKLVAFGDFNGDGKVDIASWDGSALTVYLQSADGKFAPDAKLAKDDLKEEPYALAACDSGKDGKSALVIGAGDKVLFYVPGDKPTALQADAALLKDLGKAQLCLVADFDGDGLPDVLAVFAKGSLMYKGKAAGAFEPAKACAIAAGEGQVSPCLGDFDADGLPDLLICGKESTSFWQNNGKLEFQERLKQTGEFAYKAFTNLVCGSACDFNGDGRQDLALFYVDSAPHLFFNRGFRSFGHANTIDISSGGVLPEASEGQQAGCMADFAGDGGHELVMVLPKGQAYTLSRQTTEGSWAKVALSPKAGFAGPVNVTGYLGDRCLGSWPVAPGSDGFFAIPGKATLTLKWTIPGGKAPPKDLPLEGKPVFYAVGK